MSIRIGINGFGRIGRAVFRLAYEGYEGIEIVGINDLLPAPNLAYLARYDSVHGRFSKEIEVMQDRWVTEGKTTHIFTEKDPAALAWGELGADYIIESTGLFNKVEDAQKHVRAGAKRVVISAPVKGEGVATYVMGVNHTQYDPTKDVVVSNASCTTNCLAPLIKVLLNHFGVEEGLMTTVHAVTSTQPTQDGPSKKDVRGGRSGYMNIIPSATGAAKAVALCLPEIKGKLTGMALRVPVADVSVVDLTVKLTKSTGYDNICEVFEREADTSLKGILGYTEEEVVSSDFIGDSRSSIFDQKAGIALNQNFFKIIAWYDNEIGYSHRLLDLITYMASKD